MLSRQLGSSADGPITQYSGAFGGAARLLTDFPLPSRRQNINAISRDLSRAPQTQAAHALELRRLKLARD